MKSKLLLFTMIGMLGLARESIAKGGHIIRYELS